MGTQKLALEIRNIIYLILRYKGSKLMLVIF